MEVDFENMFDSFDMYFNLTLLDVTVQNSVINGGLFNYNMNSKEFTSDIVINGLTIVNTTINPGSNGYSFIQLD